MQQLLLELAPPPPPTLGNFFPGRNGAALKALRAALEGGERFVFLWGSRGSGKTHLLRGFAEAGKAKLVAAYIAGANPDWTRAAELEAAALDEVARLDEDGQVAAFDLCNRLLASGGALAAGGEAPPAQLALRPDLRSRLASGIVLQLHPLSEAEKIAALRERARSRGIALAHDLLRYLLPHPQRDLGTQIAVLDALDRYSLQQKRPIPFRLSRRPCPRWGGNRQTA